MNEAKFYRNTNINKNNILQFPNLNNKSNIKTNSHNKNKNKNINIGSRTTQPIKNKEDIERAKQYFHDSPSRYNSLNLRNYCLFVLGINIGKRINDLLNLKISDLIKSNGTFKEWAEIIESKTGKYSDFQIHPYVQEALVEYLNVRLNNNSLSSESEYLFPSRKVNGKKDLNRNGISEPIRPDQAWRIMNDMKKELELEIRVGTHFMRKTYAYQKITNNLDNPYIIGAVSNELNHRDIKTTYRYSGYDRDVRSHLYLDNPI
jgi:integrase